jgi:hypothetical protein
MKDSIKWTIFFIEQYSGIKGIDGETTYRLFKKTGAIDYLYSSAGALHSLGIPYLINDVDKFIETQEND